MLKKIANFGAFDHDSYGDLLFAFIVEFFLFDGNYEIIHVSPSGSATPWLDSRKMISIEEAFAIDDWSGVIVGGGDIINTSESFSECWIKEPLLSIGALTSLWIGASVLATKLNIPLVWNAPGVPRKIPEQFADLVRLVLKSVDYISVRDKSSYVNLSHYTEKKIHIIPDSAIQLRKLWPAEKSLRADNKAFVVSISAGDLSVRRDDLKDAMQSLRSLTHQKVIFAPLMNWQFDSYDDYREPFEYLENYLYLQPRTTGIQECVQVIANSKGYIGNSLHGYITAVAYQLPAVLVAPYGASHAHKYEGFICAIGKDPRLSLAHTWRDAVHLFGELSKNEKYDVSRVDQVMDEHWQNISNIFLAGAISKEEICSDLEKMQRAQVEKLMRYGVTPNILFDKYITCRDNLNNIQLKMQSEYHITSTLVADQNSQTASQNSLIVEQNKLIVEQSNLLKKEKDFVDSLNKELIDIKKSLSLKELIIKEGDEQLAAQKEEWVRLCGQVSSLANELQSVYDSKSWKVTFPFRLITRSIKGFLYILRRQVFDKLFPFDTKRRLLLRFIKQFFLHPICFIKKMRLRHLGAFIRWDFQSLESAYRTVYLNRIPEAILDQDQDLSQEIPMELELFEQKDNFTRIIFEDFKNPLVSIIIPVHNQWEYTYNCLKSIKENTNDVTYEIIIADDLSSDETKNIKDYVDNVVVIRNSKNLGFLLNCNNAAIHARGKYIHFLNNDTNVQKNWLTSLVDLIEHDNTIGLVGSKLVYPNGLLQEAGGILWKDGTAWNYGSLQSPLKGIFNYVKEVDYCSGASILIPKKLFNELNGFDEYYLPAYYEDTDLAFRVRQLGYRVLYQPNSVVVHYEGISHGKDTNVGMKAYQVTNQHNFFKRWETVLAKEHYANGENVFLAKDRSKSKKTILIIDHYAPQPDKDAGSRSMWHIIKLLVKNNLNVKFWSDNLAYDPIYTPKLEALGVESYYGSEYHDVTAWFEQNGEYLDYVLLSRPHISIKYIEPIRQFTSAKVLFWGCDIHHLRLKTQLELEEDRSIREQMLAFEHIEKELWRLVDTIYYPSEDETQHVMGWLKTQGISKKAYTLPLYAFDSFPFEPWADLQSRQNIIFVAGFSHTPNVDGALWFVKEVFPKIQSIFPDIHLTLVGSKPTEEIIQLGNENITVTGFVTDEVLESFYQTARVCIAPLRYGGGMKGKVIESMKFGLPCVTTNIGAQGLESAKHFLHVATTEEEFADNICLFLQDDDTWVKNSKDAQLYCKNNYSEKVLWDIFLIDLHP